jgi:hypothetical protein
MFCAAHVVGAQEPASGAPHWPGTPPPPHAWPLGHEPQLTRLPQPSPVGPQLMFCCPHVMGVQEEASGEPHWLGTPPPPHIAGGAQEPQSSWLPQPSPAGPQPTFCWAHESGVHEPG